MKNEIECDGCMYRQVPEHFVPCLGCKNNISSIDNITKAITEQLNKPKFEHIGVMNLDGSMAYALTREAAVHSRR